MIGRSSSNQGDDSSLEDDLDFIDRTFGNNGSNIEEEKSEDPIVNTLASVVATDMSAISLDVPKPPQQAPRLEARGRYRKSISDMTDFGSLKYDYDGNRKPRRSSMKKPNNTRRLSCPISRGIGHIHSMEGTEDTRLGSESLHSVRIRGSLVPVQRRRSIEFKTKVMVQEVTPTVVLNDYNHRDLWLQADEVEAMRNDRHSFIKKYKEREAQKEKEDARKKRETERDQKLQRMKNMLHPTKNQFLHAVTSPFSTTKSKSPPPLESSSLANKIHKKPSWTNIMKRPDLFSLSPKRKEQNMAGERNDDPSSPMPEPADSQITASADPQNSPGSSSSSLSSGRTSSRISSGSFSGSGSDREVDSLRGLEKYIDRSGRVQKNMVWEAVLIEQDEQEQFGYYDDEKIARLYQKIQKQHNAQQKVLDLAQKDRQAADKYLMTPRTMKLMKKTTLQVSAKQMASLHADCDLLQSNEPEVEESMPPSPSSDDQNFHGCRNAVDTRVDELLVSRTNSTDRNQGMIMRRLSV